MLFRSGGKESHHQESQIKESQISTNAKSSCGKAEQPNRCASPPDDDENPLKESASVNPWEELRKEFRAANRGEEMSVQDERWLKEQMELRQITPGGLLELERKNPLAGFRSPMAGLKWLLNKFVTKTRSHVEIETAFKAAGPAPAEVPRCEMCAGSGRVLERTEGERPTTTDQYCDCRLGRDLKRIESRPPKTG